MKSTGSCSPGEISYLPRSEPHLFPSEYKFALLVFYSIGHLVVEIVLKQEIVDTGNKCRLENFKAVWDQRYLVIWRDLERFKHVIM